MDTEQGAQATIFLIEEDNDARPVLKRSLQSYGYRVITALDEEDALERLDGGHVQADVVLIDLVGKAPEDALNLGRRVRKPAGYDEHTPLVVMAEKYGRDLEGRDVNVAGNDWITYLEDFGQLKNLLDRLTSKMQNREEK